jgi:RNA polymerase sigma-70 factor (ECF subfamily)
VRVSPRPGEDSLDETDLIARSRDGDAEAFAALVERYRDRVHRLVWGLLRNAEDAEDVTQEVFIKAWYRLGSFEGGSAFYTWLYRVAVNTAADWRKRWRRRRALSLEDGPAGPEGVPDLAPRPDRLAHGRELGAKLSEALERMPEKFRRIVVLRDYEGLSYEEIGRVLGLPKGTVESRLFRARERLREALEPLL